MFAPYCPACGSQVLLGPDRIVRFAWDGAGRRTVVLRCACGDLVDWDRPPPTIATDVPADAA